MMTFKTPGEFAAHLRRVQATLPLAQKAGFEATAALLRDEAKDSLGHYQRSATGPFHPWEELAEFTKEERVEQGYSENEPLKRSGILRENIESSADEHEGRAGVPDRIVQHPYKDEPDNIGEIAADLEFGTAHMPPRSFLGLAAFRFGAAAAQLYASIVAAHLAGLVPHGRRPPRE